jgi:hypothetical protein
MICSGEDRDAAGTFARLVWVLWNTSNNKVWNDASESGQMLGFKAKFLWVDWFEV